MADEIFVYRSWDFNLALAGGGSNISNQGRPARAWWMLALASLFTRHGQGIFTLSPLSEPLWWHYVLLWRPQSRAHDDKKSTACLPFILIAPHPAVQRSVRSVNMVFGYDKTSKLSIARSRTFSSHVAS